MRSWRRDYGECISIWCDCHQLEKECNDITNWFLLINNHSQNVKFFTEWKVFPLSHFRNCNFCPNIAAPVCCGVRKHRNAFLDAWFIFEAIHCPSRLFWMLYHSYRQFLKVRSFCKWEWEQKWRLRNRKGLGDDLALACGVNTRYDRIEWFFFMKACRPCLNWTPHYATS